MSDHRPDLRLVPQPGVNTTLELIANARRSLAEARTLPDIRRVMEAASVAVDAAHRLARLAEAQHAAAEVVEAANEAANEAAGVRIEAQARAGALLREMAEHGGRASRAGGGPKAESQAATQLRDLGVTKSESSRWQQVAAVPSEVRQGYVDASRAGRQEVSTSGLLRHAHTAAARNEQVDVVAVADEARKRMRAVYRCLLQLSGYRPEALVMALDRGEMRHLLQALDRLPAWIEDVIGELAVHRITKEKEE